MENNKIRTETHKELGFLYDGQPETAARLDLLVQSGFRAQNFISYLDSTKSKSINTSQTYIFFDKNCGLGLKAKTKIEKDEIFLLYAGEEINSEKKARLEELREGDYLMNLKKESYIDAKPVGNESRFANHTCGEANITFDCLKSKKNIVVLKACKNIEAGDEILVDYTGGDTGDRNDMYAYIHYCRCKAKKHKLGVYHQRKLFAHMLRRDKNNNLFVKKRTQVLKRGLGGKFVSSK